METMSSPHPASLWNATAPPPLNLPSLDRDITVDCLIIGGGFTGLNAAWQLMKRGVDVCVVEANDAGWGASGRNGGMAVLRYKHGWAALADRLGDEAALLLHELVHNAVDGLEANVEELGLDGGFSRFGHITAAHTTADTEALQRDVEWLGTHAGNFGPKVLSSGEMNEYVGTTAYVGGYLDMRSAGINPLAYARELAKALVARGLPLYVSTPVTRIEKDGDTHIAHTPTGTVRTRTLIFATNGYTDLFSVSGNLHKRIIPVNTSIVATSPLPDDIRAQILPQGQLVTDTRHLVNYFRWGPGNRLIFGGRGSITSAESSDVYGGLERLLVKTFPVLQGVPIEFRWSGKVAVTLDDFPHVGQYGPGAYFALGYGGRGVALSHLLGRLVAELSLGEPCNAGPMGNTLRPIPLHACRLPAMSVVAACYRLRDLLRI